MNVIWHKTPTEIYELYPETPIEKMVSHGCWGFTDVSNETIHLWKSPSCPLEKVIEVVGHELGHLTGTTLDNRDDEEERAGEYGEVAMNAYRIATQPDV